MKIDVLEDFGSQSGGGLIFVAVFLHRLYDLGVEPAMTATTPAQLIVFCHHLRC
jgi:hypothetical protein